MNELIDYYRRQGAPGDQQMLIALLREVQEENGGVLTRSLLLQIAQSLGVKESMLSALIRRVPSLRMDSAPHLLELCQTCPKNRELHAWLEKACGTNGEAGFRLRITPCMKNCPNGPSIKWDGTLYSHATKELLQKLIAGDKGKDETP